IAVAMVILSGWRPAWAVLACLGVATAEALSIAFQVTDVPIANELVALLPYVTTLAVLVIFGGGQTSGIAGHGNRRPPRALGRL
ncbi:MAG TPA: hypothetical protein VF469_38490, partial [Kofleriaceae bacterium]